MAVVRRDLAPIQLYCARIGKRSLCSQMDVDQQNTRFVLFHVQIRSTRSKVNHHGTRMPAADPLPRVCSPARTAQILPWVAPVRRRHHSEASAHALDFSHSQMDEGPPMASHMRRLCMTSEPEGVRRDGIKSWRPASPRWQDQQAVGKRKRARLKLRDTGCGVDVDPSENAISCRSQFSMRAKLSKS